MNKRWKLAVCVVALALLAGRATTIDAATFTWDGGAGDGVWANATSETNWVGDSYVPTDGGGHEVVFVNTGYSGTSTITLTGGHNPNVNILTLNGNSTPLTFNLDSTNASTHIDMVPASNGDATMFVTAGSYTMNQTGAGSGGYVNLQGSNSQRWYIFGGASLTINAPVQGTSATRGFTKEGAGTLTMAGINTYGGAGSVTLVNGGTLTLNYATNNSTKIADAGTLTFGGGVVNLAGGSHTEVVAATTLNAGGSALTRSSGTSVLRMNGITRNTGAAIDFGAASIADTDKSNTNGILGGWATVAGADWAVSATSAADTAITSLGSYSALNTASGTDTSNSRITASATLSGSRTTNSLKIENPAASQSLALGANTLTLTSGGMLFTGTNAFSVSGTSGATRLTAGNGSGSYDLIVQQYNSGGVDISAVIGNNGANAVALTKAGTGALTLSGTNTYTGGTYVSGGSLIVSGLANLSSGSINLAGGTLQTTGNISWGSRAWTVNSVSTIDTPTGITASGQSTFSGTGTLIKTGEGILQFVSSGSGWTGPLLINAGVVTETSQRLSNVNLMTVASGAQFSITEDGNVDHSIGGPIVLNGAGPSSTGALLLTQQSSPSATNTITLSNPITLGSNSTISVVNTDASHVYTLNLSGEFNGSGKNLTKIGTGTLVIDGAAGLNNITVSAGTLKSATSSGNFFDGNLSVAADATLDLNNNGESFGGLSGAGTLLNGGGTVNPNSSANTTWSGSIQQSGNFEKDGTGTLVFSGNNTYSGTTKLTGGTLSVSNISNLGSGSLIFNGGALQATGNLALGTLSVQVNSAASTINVDSGVTVSADSINWSTSSSGTLVKIGAGLVEFGSSGSGWAGKLQIDAGTVSETSNRIGNITDVLVNSGGQFRIRDNGAGATFNIASGKTFTLNGDGPGGDGALKYTPQSGGSATPDAEITNDVILGSNTTIHVANDGSHTLTLTLNKFDAAGNDLTKIGAGTLVLDDDATINNITISGGVLKSKVTDGSGDNFYTGTVSINGGGVLDLNGNDEDGGNVTLIDGTIKGAEIGAPVFDLQSGTVSAVIRDPSGSAVVNKTTSGTVLFSGINTYTGNTTISDGTLLLGGGGANIPSGSGKGNVILNNPGTLDLGGTDETINGLSGTGTVDNTSSGGPHTLTVGDNNQTSTFDGLIQNTAGTLALTKIGSGTLTLTNTNSSFSGLVSVNGGTLSVDYLPDEGLNSALGVGRSGQDISIKNGTFRYTGGTTSTTRDFDLDSPGGAIEITNATTTLTLADSFTGDDLALTKTGPGTLVIDNGDAHIGDLNVAAGTLKYGLGVNTGNFITGDLSVASGATFDLNGNDETFGSLSGGGTLLNGGAIVNPDSSANTNWSGVIQGTGAFKKDGTGTLTFSGDNTYSGDTTINEGTLKLGGGGSNIPSGTGKGNVIINSPGLLNMGGTDEGINGLSGDGTIDNLSGSGSYTLSIGANDQSSTFTGVIKNTSGTLGLTKNGSGTITLSGASSYGGETNIDNGMLSVNTFANENSNSPLGQGNDGSGSTAISINGGTLQYTGGTVSSNRKFDLDSPGGTVEVTNASTTLTLTGSFSGDSKDFTKTGPGTLEIPGNAALGNVIVSGGTLRSATTSGNWYDFGVTVQNGATLDLAGNGEAGAGDVHLIDGTIMNSGPAATISNAGFEIDVRKGTISAAISGASTVHKTTSDTVILSSVDNTYTGATTVDAGLLQVANIVNSSVVNINGGTLQLITGAGNLTDSGTITIASGATLDLNNDGESVGTVNLDGGQIINSGGGAQNIGPAAVNSTGNSLISANVSLGSTTRTFDVTSGTLSVTGVVNSGSLTKSGGGVLELSNSANTYTGTTTVSAGLLRVADIQSSSIVNIDGGTLQLITGQGDLTNSGTITIASGATLDLNNDGEAVGTVNLHGGQIINSGGGAQNIGPAAVNSTGNSLISANVSLGNTTRTFDVTSGTLSVTGVVNSGSLTKSGGGVLELTNNNTYAGDTSINGGTLNLNHGSLANSAVTVGSGATLRGVGTVGALVVNAGGTLAPGNSPGIIGSGNFTENGTLTLEFLNHTGGAGVGYSQVDVTGSVTLNASTSLLMINDTSGGSFNPSFGQVFTIINNDNSDAVIGTFSNYAAGATVTINGKPLKIYYDDGTNGNDVVLVSNNGAASQLFVNNQWTSAATVLGDQETGSPTAFVGIEAFATTGAAFTSQPGYSGGVRLNGGTYAAVDLTASGAGTPGAVTLELVADILASEPNVTIQNLQGDSSDAIATRFHGVASANLIVEQGSFAGAISGNGSLTKQASGLLVLGNTNSYAGGTTINGGTLQINAAGALGSGAVTVNGGTLLINNLALTANNLTLNNGATLLGNGTASYSKSSYPSIGAGASVGLATTLATDVLTVGSAIRDGNASSLITVSGPGTVVISSGSTAADAYAGSWNVASGTLRLSNANALGNPGGGSNQRPLTLSGGTVETRVSAASTFTQATTVSASSSILANLGSSNPGVTHSFGALTINSSTLTVSPGSNVQTGTTQTISFSSGTLTGNPTFNVANNGARLMEVTVGALSDGGVGRTLTKSGNGTLTLNGSATSLVNGTAVMVNAGTLNSNAATALGSLANVTVANAAVFNAGASQTLGALNGPAGGSVTIGGNTLTIGNSANNLSGAFGGSISGTGGAVVKAGGGTETFTGANIYSGSTTVQGGTLRLDAAGSIQETSGILVGTAAGNGALLVTTNAAHRLAAIGVNNSVVLGSVPGIVGTFTLAATPGTTVTADGNFVVGDTGQGLGTQNSGNLLVSNSGGTTGDGKGDFIIGSNAAGQPVSAYTINGGNLTADNIFVGVSGGTNVDGNRHTLNVAGSGVIVTASQDFRVGNGTQSVGYVHQTGANSQVNIQGANTFTVSSGVYDLNAMGGSVVDAGNAFIGTGGGNATMSHNLGSVSIGLDLTVGSAGSTGTYTLANNDANTLTVGGNEFIGAGTGVGTFTQNGGAHTLTGTGPQGNMTLGGSGHYQLAGGTLDFQDYVGAGAAWTPNNASTLTTPTGAQFEFTGGTLIDVSNIVVSDGSAFEQSGGNFYVGRNGNGPAAQTTITGGFSLLGGVLHLDAFGVDPTPEECCDGVAGLNDQLTVLGDVTLDSVVAIDYHGFTPQFGDVFTLICADHIEVEDGFALTGGYFRLVPTGLGPEQPQYALQAIVPEPASVALWSVVALAGVAAAVRARSRRRGGARAV